MKAVETSTYKSGKGIGNTVFSTVSHFLSTEEPARSGICKKCVGFFGWGFFLVFFLFFILSFNSCRVLTRVHAHTNLLSAAVLQPPTPRRPSVAASAGGPRDPARKLSAPAKAQEFQRAPFV